MEIGEERDILTKQLKEFQKSFNKESTNTEKGDKTIQLLQKYLK